MNPCKSVFVKVLSSSLLVVAMHGQASSLGNFGDSDYSNYRRLHDINVATSMYQSFKNDEGNDPFYHLDEGYISRYKNDVEANAILNKERLSSEFLKDESSSLYYRYKDLSASESHSLSEMYNEHFNDDGEFDAESYAESYLYHLNSREISRKDAMTSRFDAMMTTLDRGLELQKVERKSLTDDIEQAQDNLIGVLQNSTHAKRNDFLSKHSEAFSRVLDRGNLASDTVALSAIYADCGSACDFPESVIVNPVTPPVEPDDPTPDPPSAPPRVEYCDGLDLWRTGGDWIHYECP